MTERIAVAPVRYKTFLRTFLIPSQEPSPCSRIHEIGKSVLSVSIKKAKWRNFTTDDSKSGPLFRSTSPSLGERKGPPAYSRPLRLSDGRESATPRLV